MTLICPKRFLAFSGARFPSILATNHGNEVVSDASYAAPLPAGITAGKLLLMLTALYSSSAATMDTPSGWTELFEVAGPGRIRSLAAYCKTADGSEGSTLAMTSSTAAFKASVSYLIDQFAGTPEAGTPATGTTSAPNPPSLAPSWGAASGTLFLAVCGQHEDSLQVPQTAPANYGDLIQDFGDNSSSDRPRIAVATRKLVAASEDPAAFGGTIANWAANTIAIRGAA
ncbi:MAG: hypothetical protein AB7S70_00650 [Hyphomicrobium sp.]|uniref:hypothetical protein n=1 Tax=Hyphomicrobium sp. TaxID=82 RepID=UPI003D0D1769